MNFYWSEQLFSVFEISNIFLDEQIFYQLYGLRTGVAFA